MNAPRFPPIQQKPSGQFSLILAGELAWGTTRLGAWQVLTEAQLVPMRVVGSASGRSSVPDSAKKGLGGRPSEASATWHGQCKATSAPREGVSGMYAEIESYGLLAFEALDLIEEERYKATQCVLPALLHVLGRLGGRNPSASTLQGGPGGS